MYVEHSCFTRRSFRNVVTSAYVIVDCIYRELGGAIDMTGMGSEILNRDSY